MGPIIVTGWLLGWSFNSLKVVLRQDPELANGGHNEVDSEASAASEEVGEGRLDYEHDIQEPIRSPQSDTREQDSVLEQRGGRAVIEEQEEIGSEERERLAVEEGIRQSLEEKQRQQLLQYKFGDKIHLANFKDLPIDDVTKIRLALFGPAGSGKSSFINTCERVVLQKPRGTALLTSSNMEGTTILEEFLHEMPLMRLVDTRGQDDFGELETLEIKRIISGVIRPGEYIDRDPSHPQVEVGEDIPSDSLVHGVIFVVKSIDVRLRNDFLRRKLERFRKQDLQRQGMQPVTVVTHLDKIREDELEAVKTLASAATGSSPHCTFLLTNYCEDSPAGNRDTVSTTLKVLNKALLVAEKYVKTAKLRLKNAQKNAVQAALETYNEPGGLPGTVRNASLSMLFRDFLQGKYQWSNMQVKQALEILRGRDVITVLALVVCWDDVEPLLIEKCGSDMTETIKRHLYRFNIDP